jgi:hypothetical protein
MKLVFFKKKSIYKPPTLTPPNNVDHEYLTEVKIKVAKYNAVKTGGPPSGEWVARVPIPGPSQRRVSGRKPK